MTSHSHQRPKPATSRIEVWREMVDGLRRAPEWEGEVELVQTHISVVLLGRDKVLKLKKPVDFGFLDYTTIQKRHKACADEVRLNRRLCEKTYLGVQPIVEVGGAPRLTGDGPVLDYGVLMRRLPADRMLDELVRRQEVTEEMIRRVAGRLLQFHAEAGRSPKVAAWGSWKQIRGNWIENFEQTGAYRGRTIGASAYDAIRKWVEYRLACDRDRFENRVRENRIVDGHGDVRCESICLTNGICIFDCIEFNDRFRCCDPASEVAFLAMDLDSLGRPDLGYYFSETYESLGADAGLFRLLPFYRCYRAYVRGKVLSFRLDAPEFSADEKEKAATRAAAFFELALRYASPLPSRAIVVVTGLSGTGKTSLAKAIAGELGLRAVSTDAIRHRLFGAEKGPAVFGHGVYSPRANARTYEELIGNGIRLTEENGGVILDGTFLRLKDRERVRRAAAALGCAVRWIECTLPSEVARERIEERRRRSDGLSDATWEVYLRQRAEADLPEPGCLELDTRESLSACSRKATDWLRQELARRP